MTLVGRRLFLLGPLLLLICQISAQHQTGYDENYARLMFYFTAGAYSPVPAGCVNETSRLSGQPFEIYSSTISDCDTDGNSCAFYVAVSPIARQVVIVFRGTKGKKQLFHETLQSLQPNVDFYGSGKVNRYFFRALNSMWEMSSSVLTDPRYQGFSVTFTGHSLGGALASLAAMRTVLERLRDSSQIKLYTFGQPRVGNHKFAVEHDRLVPQSYRVVNRNDVVPHLPFCHFSDKTDPIDDSTVVDQNNPRPVDPDAIHDSDDDDFNLSDAIKKPCNGDSSRKAYHHGTEIWYADGMVGESTYRECLGMPKNEDHTCSNGVRLENGWLTVQRYINDHLNYFGQKVSYLKPANSQIKIFWVSAFGKAGCLPVEYVPPPRNEAGFGAAQPEQPPNRFQKVVYGVLEKLNRIKNGK